MFETFMEQGVFVYVIAASGLLGILAQLVLGFYYRHMCRDAVNMGSARGKQLGRIKKRYLELSALGNEIRDLDVFVETGLTGSRCFGIYIGAIENFVRSMLIIIGGTGIFGAAYEYYKTGAFRDSLIVLLWCIGGETLSLFIYSLMGIGENKRILSCRIKDYLENSLAHRMKREEEKSRRINLDIHRGKKPEAAAPVAATLAAGESEEKKKPEPDKGQGTGRKKKKEIDISDEMLEQLLASVIG